MAHRPKKGRARGSGRYRPPAAVRGPQSYKQAGANVLPSRLGTTQQTGRKGAWRTPRR